MDLKELGLSFEDIEEQIVSNVTRRIVDDAGHDIRKEVMAQVNSQIQNVVSQVVLEAMEGEFQPVTNWGEKDGEPTTIREMFKSAVIDWWKTTVNQEGKPSGSYSGQKRSEWVAEKVIAKMVRSDMKDVFTEIIKEIKSETKKSVTAIIQKEIETAWRRK